MPSRPATIALLLWSLVLSEPLTTTHTETRPPVRPVAKIVKPAATTTHR